MAIRGADGMTDQDVAALIEQGGRVVVFSYCISVLVLTFRRTATVLVRPGRSVVGAGMQYTALSFVAGWWGFPFGLIFTPISIVQNLMGGKDVTGHFRALLSGPPATGLPPAGRSVVVPWSDGRLYTGTVLDARGSQIYVRFPNGHEEWVPADRVRAG